jgi:hypothetical protein
MATLADVLRQTGYAKDGQLQAPTPTQPNLSTMAGEYIKQIPAQTQANLLRQRQNIDDALVMTPEGAKIGDQQAFSNFMSEVPFAGALTAFHGTPHKIQGAFDISKVGTGEGAQHYGHGMYFAESPEIASTFKTTKGQGEFVGIGDKMVKTDSPQGQVLKDITMLGRKAAIRKYPDQEAFIKLVNPDDVKFECGNLYKVDIPDEQIPKTLDWYESFKNQSKDVQESLRNLGDEIKFGSGKESVADWLKMTGNLPPHLTNQSGNAIYNELAAQLGGAKQASEYLNNLGIKGIKYENFQVKKGAGANTNNYVMFDPSTVKILEENGKLVTRREIIEKELNKK